MKIFGLLGYPLTHSLSPALHNAALSACEMEGIYLPLPVDPANLAAAMAGVRAFRLAGLNVTIPHKVSVMTHLDGLTPLAEETGAVNTIFWEGDRLLGDNTDVAGYRQMLKARLTDVAGKALVLGAGGAARCVVRVLVEAGFEIAIAARRRDAALELIALAQNLGGCACARSWDDRALDLEDANLVVNTTSIGMGAPTLSPLELADLSKLPGEAIVHDLVYTPRPTRLLSLAARAGHSTVDGGVMLVHQAASAFSRWTGYEAPLAQMQAAFNQEVKDGVS